MGLLPIILAASLVAIGPYASARISHAFAVSDMRVSADVKALPTRPDILVSPLSASDPGLKISAADAVRAAESQTGLLDSEIDRNIGIVRAIVSIHGNPLHQRERVWIVTADVESHPHAMIAPDVVFHKLCIVIDARTGQYEFGFPADATRASSAKTASSRAEGSR